MESSTTVEKGQFLIFIGYADDAEMEAGAIYALEHDLQRELEGLKKVNPEIPFSHVRCWKWKEDASSEVGGQKTTIDPVIENAAISVFVFKDRMGTVTWEEIQNARDQSRRRWVITLFPKAPSDLTKLTDPSYISNWNTLIQRRRELTADWNAENSKSVRPVEEYTPDTLTKIAFDRIKGAMIDVISSRAATTLSPEEKADPAQYLTTLLNECKTIDIRGLKVSDGNAHKLDIEKLYTPLHITGSIEDLHEKRDMEEVLKRTAGEKTTLDAVLTHRAAVIIGDPGAGKSTFLKRITTILSRSLLNGDTDDSTKKLGLDPAPLPVFVRLFDLALHIRNCRDSKESGCPAGDDNPAWLFHYLGRLSSDRRWGLAKEWFEEQSENGRGIIILLDGLDEAPDMQSRNTIVRLVNKLKNDCKKCRVVVTSRPVAYEEGIQLSGFFRSDIAPLDDEGVRTFLRQWCEALYYDVPESAKDHYETLRSDVFSRSAIRRMASNPVMLTALAVLHWNNKKLPEQRAELYESVIGWLLDSRDLKRPGRTSRDECREHLQAIALAMQEWQGGRRQALERGEMIDLLEGMMSNPEEKKRRTLAERFIGNEELDSGIIRARGEMVEFWHLTFLEYLAARELAGMSEGSQREKLLKREVIDDPAWRETLLLFIGVLWSQGRKKVEGFFSAMLDQMELLNTTTPDNEKLSREARCFGLMGAMLRDLQPYEYTVGDLRFESLRTRVEQIFDAEKAGSIEIKVRVAAAEALGQAGDHRIVVDMRTEEALKKMFVPIPKGEFWMGAQKENRNEKNYDEEIWDDESPVHKVSLDAFSISRFPVTVAQYELFVNDGGYENDTFWKTGREKEQDKPEDWEQQLMFPNRPVTGVSWYEVKAFCSWAGLDLPTEAQWERAARGPYEDNRKYPWGNEPITPVRANYSDTNIMHLSPVGCFPGGNSVWNRENGMWLADMIGNVFEWCSDWNSEYSSDAVTNPKGPDTGSSRVVRGGSCFDFSGFCRCAFRIRYAPGFRYVSIGFRVVSSRR